MAILPFGLPEPQSETLRRLCQQVREAPGEAWSSGQAAKACSMSERTLNRHFQQQTSLTWSEWVRRAKLMEALVRLAQGYSVLRVALELGYGSHSAFSAMFRRVMGVAPATIFVPGLIGGAERIAQRLQRGARHVIIDTHAPVAFSLRKNAADIGHRPAVAARAERMLMIVLDHKRLPKQRAEPAGCGGEQAVALALQASGFAVVTQRCLQGKLAILLAGALIIEQRQRRLRLQPVARAEQLPQRMVGHLFAVAIGGLLNVLAEVLLQPAGQFQTMILFDKPGAAALPRLAVDADHRLIAAAYILRVNGQVGHLPRIARLTGIKPF